MTTSFQAPPSDLSILTPFLRKAYELRVADPALSYWFNYHAAQIGIPLHSKVLPTSKSFLMQLLDTLEAQKKSLSDNEIVNGDEIVAKAYIENAAFKIFALADKEDRSRKATKVTAGRFLATASMLEILNTFGPLESNIEERLKYARWKAGDISKAIREGRQPKPGAPGETNAEGDFATDDDVIYGTEKAADRLAGLSAAHPQEEDEYVEREMAKLTAADSAMNDAPVAFSSNASPHESSIVSSKSRPVSMHREQSRLSFDGRAANVGQETDDSIYMRGASSPNFSRPLNSSGASPTLPANTGSAFSPFHSQDSATSPSPRPLPMPPSTSSSFRREGLPLPPGGQGSVNPLMPPPHLLSPSTSSPLVSQTPPSFPTSLPLQPSIPSMTRPSAPSIPTTTHHPSAPTIPIQLPSSLDHVSSARVQKLAKWTVSALDYEDVETARKHLREALDICEGKLPAGK